MTRSWSSNGQRRRHENNSYSTALSTCSSTRFLEQDLRRLISRNANSPPFWYNSLKR